MVFFIIGMVNDFISIFSYKTIKNIESINLNY